MRGQSGSTLLGTTGCGEALPTSTTEAYMGPGVRWKVQASKDHRPGRRRRRRALTGIMGVDGYRGLRPAAADQQSGAAPDLGDASPIWGDGTGADERDAGLRQVHGFCRDADAFMARDSLENAELLQGWQPVHGAAVRA